MANYVFAIISGVIICVIGEGNEFLRIALWLFMTLHIGEIVSYLFVGSIFLVSDMELVNQYMPKMRIPNLILGAALTVMYVYILTLVPSEFRGFVAIWNIVTVMSMCVGRIIFTIIAKKKSMNSELDETA
jgi:hypothetical protein